MEILLHVVFYVLMIYFYATYSKGGFKAQARNEHALVKRLQSGRRPVIRVSILFTIALIVLYVF